MRARYLADTSALNRFGEGAPIWRERLAARQIAICQPVLLELLSSAAGRADYRKLAQDLGSLPILDLTSAAADRGLETQYQLAERSQHGGPTPVDLLVAAIAERAELTLLHYDRHFDAIARVTGQPTEWLARRGSLR